MRSTGAQARREKARGEMRDTILEAARHLVANGGLHALSMRAIAREIEYSPAALYEYFPAKEDLCCALYFEGAGGLAARMRAALESLAPDVGAETRLMALGHAYRVYALEQPDLYLLAFGSSSADFSPDSEAMDKGNEAFDLLVTAARSGVDGGTFIDLPAEAIALSCWASVHGFVMLEISGLIAHKLGTPGESSARVDDLFAATLWVLGAGFMRR